MNFLSYFYSKGCYIYFYIYCSNFKQKQPDNEEYTPFSFSFFFSWEWRKLRPWKSASKLLKSIIRRFINMGSSKRQQISLLLILTKGWLPLISASAQATYQSDAAAWPETMQGVMQQLGVAHQRAFKNSVSHGGRYISVGL